MNGMDLVLVVSWACVARSRVSVLTFPRPKGVRQLEEGAYIYGGEIAWIQGRFLIVRQIHA